MRTIMKKLAGDRRGATAIEYGLIAGLVALAVVTVLTSTGTSLTSLFTNTNSSITTAAVIR